MTRKQRTITRWLAWLDQQAPDHPADKLAEQVEFFVLEFRYAKAKGLPALAGIRPTLSAWLRFRLPGFVAFLRIRNRLQHGL
jgi:hypothetical protein